MKIFVKILLITLWIALAAGVVVVMSFSAEKHDSKPCQGIKCSIDFRGNQPLLSCNGLIAVINKKFGKPQTKNINEIDVSGISTFVRSNPYLENTDVAVSIEGVIQIKAKQCVPLIRFLSADGGQHYLDRNGRLMPTNPDFPYKALLATGNISNAMGDGGNIFEVPLKNKQLRFQLLTLYNLHYLSGIITSDSVLNSLIEQIYLTTDNKILMVTKAGSHVITFGDTTNAAEKLENLKYFYKNALFKTGWNRYRKVNLEYKNQIVCTK